MITDQKSWAKSRLKFDTGQLEKKTIGMVADIDRMLNLLLDFACVIILR